MMRKIMKKDDNDDDIKKEVLTNTEINDITDQSELNKNNTTLIEKDLEETTMPTTLEKNENIINEIEILPPNESSDTVTLKKPNEVYMEIYKEARRKAKDAKKCSPSIFRSKTYKISIFIGRY